MTYDNWKCTDPNDQFLGLSDYYKALDRFRDGELSLGDFGEVLLEEGYSPREVRQMLSEETKYPIPIGYFGEE